MEKALGEYRDIHTHGPAAAEVIRNLNLYEAPVAGYAYSAGIHPYDATEATDTAWQWLEDVCRRPEVVAIGEAGLDRLRVGFPEPQTEIFIRQALLADEVDKPLIIHCVRAWGELIGLKRRLKPSLPWIIHGFRGKPALARQLLDAGFHLSFGKKYNPDSLALTPPSRRYGETDEDY